jgi:hypothetical protein
MAATYDQSALAAANQLLLEAEMANPEPLSSAILKELSTRRATNTNFLFALKTILKVPPPPNSPLPHMFRPRSSRFHRPYPLKRNPEQCPLRS